MAKPTKETTQRRQCSPGIIGGLTTRRPRPLPPAFAHEEHDDHDQQDQEDYGDENAGDDSDLLRERVVHRRQNNLVHFDQERGAALVDDVLPVEVELRGDAGEDGVVVPKRGPVLDRVVHVSGVVVSHVHDFRLCCDVDVGFGWLGPAQLGCRKPSGGGTANLKR